MAKYNKEMTIGEILEINPNVAPVLTGFGMHCFGCPMSQAETIEEAAQVHDVDAELIIQKLEEFEAEQQQDAPKKCKRTCKKKN